MRQPPRDADIRPLVFFLTIIFLFAYTRVFSFESQEIEMNIESSKNNGAAVERFLIELKKVKSYL